MTSLTCQRALAETWATTAREVAENAHAPAPKHIARLVPPFVGQVEHLITRHTERDGREHTTAA
ncbi:hypothetical protein [Actinomadura sp. 3N508]|uniref:hypothetical protein n=1 Tax=Actinomadura sp. 3N508 TaxID=3375153 RepID=UPI00379F605A